MHLRRQSWTWALIAVAMAGSSCSRRADRPDILLVTIDTLRADHVGCYGYAAAATPTIDRLAREGVRYESCESPVPITLPAHASLFTGRLPAQHGVRNNSTHRLPASLPTLAQVLNDDGYATGAFVGALPLTAGFGLDRGFDAYDDQLPENPNAGFYFAERPAQQVVEAALNWLRVQPANRPVFAWVHFFEPHQPYALLPSLATEFADRPYDGEIAAADLALSTLLDGFESNRDRQRLTVVTADHGEGLGDHGEPTHTLLLFESTLHVPLVVHWPDHLPAGSVVREPVGLIDVAPTILQLAGAKESALDGQGVALNPPRDPPRRDLVAETVNPLESYGWSPAFALRNGSQKVIRSAIPRAFDLARDPQEQTNLLSDSESPDWANDLLQRLDDHLRATSTLWGDAASRQPSAEEIEALAALGYVAGTMPADQVEPGALLEAMQERPDAVERMPEFVRTDDAKHLVEASKFAEAIDVLRELVQQSPRNAQAWMMLGGALQELGDNDAAIVAFEQASSQQPQLLAPHVNLARLLVKAGRGDEAVPHYYWMLDLQPNNLQWVRETVACLLAQNQTDAAVQVLDDASKRSFDPRGTSWIHGGLAHLLVPRGELDLGLQHLRTARAAYDDPQLALLETQALEQQGQNEAARANLEQALAVYPNHPGLLAKAREIGLR